MIHKNMKGIAVGAVIGTLLGSMGALLGPQRKKTRDWLERTKALSENVMEEVRNRIEPKKQNNFPATMKGIVIGLVVGAASALLLTPKTGKQLRNDINKKYKDMAEKKDEIATFLNKHKTKTAIQKKFGLSKKASPSRSARIKSKRA